MGDKASNSEEKDYGYLYAVFGGLSFFAAIILAIYSTYEIHTATFHDIAEKNNATQQALALPLFFTTLTGMFYVLYNLQLQRKTLLAQIVSNEQNVLEFKQQVAEAKDSNKHFENQNKTLLNQQADNSFFNLLEHHKLFLNNMSISNEKILILYNKLRIDSITYKKNVEIQEFNSITKTQCNPTYKYDLNKSDDFKFLSGYFNNIRLIIEFINLNFSEDYTKLNFYHKIFYNSINSINQRLLGAAIDYKIFDIPSNKGFDYLDSYKDKDDWYKSTQPSFPVLKLNGSDSFDTIDIKSESLNDYSEKIEIVSFFSNDLQLKLNNYVIKIIENSGAVSYNETFTINRTFGLGDEIEIDLGVIFQNIIGNETLSVSKKFSIAFLFKYSEFEFTIYQNYVFERKYISLDNYINWLKRINNINN